MDLDALRVALLDALDHPTADNAAWYTKVFNAQAAYCEALEALAGVKTLKQLAAETTQRGEDL
ncbi:hypothetical protein LWF01_02700 [Saxibacter everestensis]|uniref:Uncharacterized protein n=1 Tax=Saxibacter everestensis TaxID=2909229 RepID=A0ABY8QUK8_9MICO|nr:hypothetical protein LWF01_02700 [Brevibacteriaceae bacterium ZFBP1038]